MKKIILVTNIPNHYRIPLLNELYHLLRLEGVQLIVVFGALGYALRKIKVDLKSCEFPHKVLEQSGMHNGTINYKGLSRFLAAEDPDSIIVSGYNKATFKTLFYSFNTNTPYFIWSGSIQIGNRKTSLLKKLYRRIVIKYAKGFVAYGTLAKQYMISLGAASENVYPIGNTVDTSQIASNVKIIREKFTKNDNVKRLLYLGYLTPLKNLFPLLVAIDELRQSRTDFILDIVGDGESRTRLEQEVSKRGLLNLVVFHGFKQRKDVPKFYAKADVFLFQTEADIWGLVLNEAMSAALPVLVSKRAGAASDLIQEGETGFMVDFHNTKEVLYKLNWLLDHPAEAKQIGERAASFIQSQYTIKAVASRFKDAILS